MIKERNYYFDNAKSILIFLVVLGHFIEPIVYINNTCEGIFLFIYLFHMPAFIFISGYFSNFQLNIKQIFKLIKKFLIPYIVVQIAFVIFTNILGVRDYRLTLKTPYYIYWYIFAMFVWNLVMKLILKTNINLKYIILISIIVGVLSGYNTNIGVEWSLSRILIFFPFFVLGYYFKTNKIEISNIINKKRALIILLVLILLLIYKNINSSWLYCNTSFVNMGVSGYQAAIKRVIVYLGEVLSMICFFSIVPREKTLYTYIGENTFFIYLAHGFIVKWLLYTGFYKNFTQNNTLFKLFTLIVSSLLVVIVFSINMKYIKNKTCKQFQYKKYK